MSRTRFNLKQEFLLALLPTLVVLLMLGGVEVFSRQRLLFASLASSAFLIYQDPEHPSNGVRTVVIAQSSAALIGFIADWIFGPGYLAAGIAMLLTIVLIIALNVMHPPAVSTALIFAFRANPASSLFLFGLSLLMIVLLVAVQHTTLWLLRRYRASNERLKPPQ